jgi:hypothetical protein
VLEGLNDLSERYRKFRLEWEDGPAGHLRWFIDDVFMFEIGAEALGKYTACGQSPADVSFVCEHTPARTMPAEPMSIVLNSALGTWNGGVSGTRGSLPGEMFVDYVRVWQRAGKLNVGCDPPDYPTREYIDAHHHLYGEPVRPRSEETCEPVYPPRTRGVLPAAAASSDAQGGHVVAAGGGAGHSWLIALTVVAAVVVAAGVYARASKPRGAAANSMPIYSSVGRANGADESDMHAPMLPSGSGDGQGEAPPPAEGR